MGHPEGLSGSRGICLLIWSWGWRSELDRFENHQCRGGGQGLMRAPCEWDRVGAGSQPFNTLQIPSHLPMGLPALARSHFTQASEEPQELWKLGLFWVKEVNHACALLLPQFYAPKVCSQTPPWSLSLPLNWFRILRFHKHTPKKMYQYHTVYRRLIGSIENVLSIPWLWYLHFLFWVLFHICKNTLPIDWSSQN